MKLGYSWEEKRFNFENTKKNCQSKGRRLHFKNMKTQEDQK